MNKLFNKYKKQGRVLAIAIVCAAILVQTIMPIFEVGSTDAATIYRVGEGQNYATISEVINKIEVDGVTEAVIEVYPGVYKDIVEIKSGVDLTIHGMGKTKDEVVIMYNYEGPVKASIFTLNDSDKMDQDLLRVRFKNLSIKSSKDKVEEKSAIRVKHAKEVILDEVLIDSFAYGYWVDLSISSHLVTTIQDSEFSNSFTGVVFDYTYIENLEGEYDYIAASSVTNTKFNEVSQMGLAYLKNDDVYDYEDMPILNATNNYWGDCSGPNDIYDHNSNPKFNLEGEGAKVFGKVDYRGFECDTPSDITPPEITIVEEDSGLDDKQELLTVYANATDEESNILSMTYIEAGSTEEVDMILLNEPYDSKTEEAYVELDVSDYYNGDYIMSICAEDVENNRECITYEFTIDNRFDEPLTIIDQNLDLDLSDIDNPILTLTGTAEEIDNKIKTIKYRIYEDGVTGRSIGGNLDAVDGEYDSNREDGEIVLNLSEQEMDFVKNIKYIAYLTAINEDDLHVRGDNMPFDISYDNPGDTTPPDVSIDELIVGDYLTYSVTANDAESPLKEVNYKIIKSQILKLSGDIYKNQGEDYQFITESGDIVISSLDEGSYIFKVCATDESNSNNTRCVERVFKVNTPPVKDNDAPIVETIDVFPYSGELYIESRSEDSQSPIKSMDFKILKGWRSKELGDDVVIAGDMYAYPENLGLGQYEEDLEVTAYASDFKDPESNPYVNVSGLEDGEYTIEICSTDIYDNTGCSEIEGVIDVTAPVITDNLKSKTLKEGESLNDTVSMKDSASGALAYILYDSDENKVKSDYLIPDINKDGSYPKEYSWNLSEILDMDKVDTSRLPEGEYTLEFYIEDQAFNATEVQVVKYVVENVKPEVELKSNYTKVYEYATIEFTGMFEDPSSVSDTPDDSDWYYTVTYGDGNKYSSSGVENPGKIKIPANKYTTAGTYEVKLTVCESKDNPQSENACGSDTVTIKVYKYVQYAEKPENEKEGKFVVEGYVYEDIDEDGMKDVDEIGVEKIEVSLKQTGEEEIIAVTDETGYWKAEILAGEVIVNVDNFTLPDDAELIDGAKTVEIDEDTEIDFAYEISEPEVKGESTCIVSEMSVLSGYIYKDSNKDNIKNSDEKGVSDIELVIYQQEDGEEKIIEIVTTDSDGYWELEVCTGSYRVRVDEDSLPEGVKMEKSEDSVVVSTNQDKEMNFNYQEDSSWMKQNCIWIGLGVIIVVLLFVLGAVLVRNSDDSVV